MKRATGCVIAVFVFCLLGASSASGYLVYYKEGNTNVDTGSGLVWAVKPSATGQNNWWWYINNNLNVDTAVCYRYQIDGGGWKAPNGSNYSAPTGNNTGTLPAANASICEGPYTDGTKGPLQFAKSLTGLVNGQIATYCAEEWFKSGGDWDNSADPEQCSSVKIDTVSPTITVDLRQGGNPVSATNSPGSVTDNIGYSDSASQPWNRGSVWGDNRLCTTTSMACNSGNTFNFSATCSNGTKSLSQTFTCPMGTPPGDGTFYQCIAGFDGAVLDTYPSLIADNVAGQPNTFTNDDPTGIGNTPANTIYPQTFNAGTGNYGIGCDSVLIDTAAPNTSITGGPAEGSSSADTTPTFTFTSTEAGGSFQCKVDGGSYATCSSGYTPTLGTGGHIFSVRAIDAAGNTDPSPATRGFTITGPPDTTPPDTSITAGPAEGSTTDDSTPEFSFTSTEAGSSFKCRVDSAPFATCTSPHTTATLSDGSHTFQVYATDSAGNTDPSQASRSFTVATGTPDTTPPETTITTNLPGGQTSDTTPTFEFTSSENGSSFECQVDSGTFTACTSPRTTGTLALGSHTFSVRATDPSGNTDPTPASKTFTVVNQPGDTTPPRTTIRTKPKKSTTSRKAKFTFASNEAGSKFTCKLDKGPYRSCTSPFSKTVKPGKHSFSVKAKDSAGNTDPSPATYTWKVRKP